MELIMSDFKSKLPDLKEIGLMAGKLFKDIRTSVSEIVETYKEKHPSPPQAESEETKPEKKAAESSKKKE